VQAGERTFFPLYHPAAALHNPTLRATLEDDARALGEALRAGA
jgi:DNA polymerase